jgi:NAD(P)H dehydrogenase (quinone)
MHRCITSIRKRGYSGIRACLKLAFMKRALLLFGHADENTFNHGLAAGYADGFQAAGGRVDRIDLAALRFDPVLHHGYRVPQPLEPDLLMARDAIEAADHLVWVFPTYWASPPAVVRGFVDRLFLPGWAFKFGPESALPKGLLAGRSARVITTMDTPAWWYTGVTHRCLHRSFGTATLSFCGLAPLSFTSIHGVREMGDAERAMEIEKVGRLGQRDARARARRRVPRLTPQAG